MKAEKYIVSTTVRGVTRSKIWDSAKPIPVDLNQNWLLEQTGEKIRVRTYNNQVGYDVNHDNVVSLPHELQLRVVPINHVTPPYQLPDGAKSVPEQQDSKQLLAFAGVGRGIISCQPVHSAYVAYTRKQPVFTFYQSEDGYKIKPLLDGVKFKLRKQKPIAGPIGEEWSITPEQLYGASVIRGSHWWRFNLIPTSEVLTEGPDSEALREGESIGLKRALTILLLLFLMFGLAVFFAPRPEEKKPEEVKEAPIVKFVAPPVPKEKHKIVAPVAPPEKKKQKVAVIEKKAEPKPDPEPVVAEKKPEPVKIKNDAHEKTTKKAPTKPKDAPEAKITQPTPAKETSSSNESAQAAAAAKASAAAASKLRMLRSALGSATHLAQTAVGKPTTAGKAAEMFSGGASSPISGATEIKPSYTGGNSKVAGVGGGYAKGEHATANQGKGSGSSSFVSIDAGGPTVEEGLRKEEVGAVIHKHMAEVRYCHETAMLYHPNLEGKVAVAFVINATGTVTKASVQSSSLPDKTLEECIMKRLVTWKFPRPKGGVTVSVTYPFLFKTLGGE